MRLHEWKRGEKSFVNIIPFCNCGDGSLWNVIVNDIPFLDWFIASRFSSPDAQCIGNFCVSCFCITTFYVCIQLSTIYTAETASKTVELLCFKVYRQRFVLSFTERADNSLLLTTIFIFDMQDVHHL